MRYFIWVDFQYEILAIFIGLISLIMVYAAWGSYPKRRIPRTFEEIDERRGHEMQTGHNVEKNPIAPFLIYTYIIIAFWSFFYMIYMWASSSNF